MKKHNCWEIMKCGRESGGARADKSGVCPVASETSADGLNDGSNGGRLCWMIDERGCKDKDRCPNLKHKDCCIQCEFRSRVAMEEGLKKLCEATGSFLSLSCNKREQV